jgi:hypothetical protein
MNVGRDKDAKGKSLLIMEIELPIRCQILSGKKLAFSERRSIKKEKQEMRYQDMHTGMRGLQWQPSILNYTVNATEHMSQILKKSDALLCARSSSDRPNRPIYVLSSIYAIYIVIADINPQLLASLVAAHRAVCPPQVASQ